MRDSVQQITSMVHRYCELFDTGQLDEFAAQFEHGQWHRADPGAEGTRRWIGDHVHLYDGVPRTKHLTTNLTVQVDEEAALDTKDWELLESCFVSAPVFVIPAAGWRASPRSST